MKKKILLGLVLASWVVIKFKVRIFDRYPLVAEISPPGFYPAFDRFCPDLAGLRLNLSSF